MEQVLEKKYNVNDIRKDFPVLHQEVNGKSLVYFDNAASSQKPVPVIAAIDHYYRTTHSNVHRGVHYLSQKATDAMEAARIKVQNHLHVAHAHEIIFTKGVTDGINLVASAYRESLKPGDEILISALEHHSNIVPWQMACEKSGATLKVIPVSDQGELDMDAFEDLLNERTQLVAVNHISNALGTVNPVAHICRKAHQAGAKVLIDGAQSAPHCTIDVQELDADFYTLSSHKVYGPTGVGILYGKENVLQEMPPYQGGGEMIAEVSFEKTTYADLPHKFEAGTPNIAGNIALGTALDYLNKIGIENVARHEDDLLSYATQSFTEQIPGARVIGEAREKAGVLSFLIDGTHPYDVGMILDKLGVAVRTGHHCAQPLMERYDIPGTIRASFAMYNTRSEIDQFIAALQKAHKMLS